jgi:putative membrane protein insertion efficiency factor
MNAQQADAIPEHDHMHDHAMDDLGLEHEPEHETAFRDIPVTASNLPRLAGLGLIRVYQMTLSKTIPSGTCRFYPTCSHYGYQAIVKHGLIKGSGLAVWRVARCQPFSKGGYDPVP